MYYTVNIYNQITIIYDIQLFRFQSVWWTTMDDFNLYSETNLNNETRKMSVCNSYGKYIRSAYGHLCPKENFLRPAP